MNNPLDKLLKLQQAWQAQCNKPVDVNPEQLLIVARLERRIYFWCDMFLIAFFVCIGIFMAWPVYRDIHKNWPFLISVASDAWVVGYVLFNRWLRQLQTAHYDDSMLAHVERSIQEIEHRMRLDRNNLWWYILPIALGCMLPPAFFFAMDYSKRPLFDSLMPMLVTEVLSAAVFYSSYWTINKAGRVGRESQRKELQALQALRETLLHEESGK